MSEPFKFKSFQQVQISFKEKFPYSYTVDFISASPLAHEGLVYLLNSSGILTVVDAQAGAVLYQKMLDLDQFFRVNESSSRGTGCSPTLAGKYIYITSNFGTTLVLKPGRAYEQVAKNRIEEWVPVPNAGWADHVERTVACPVFEGSRMYMRAEASLYCIGEK